MTPTPATTPLDAFNRYAKHDRLCDSIGYDYPCSCGLAEARDALSAVAEPPLLRERYWCGCVREARWTRCERHPNVDHDDEPQTRAIEERAAAPAGETRGLESAIERTLVERLRDDFALPPSHPISPALVGESAPVAPEGAVAEDERRIPAYLRGELTPVDLTEDEVKVIRAIRATPASSKFFPLPAPTSEGSASVTWKNGLFGASDALPPASPPQDAPRLAEVEAAIDEYGNACAASDDRRENAARRALLALYRPAGETRDWQSILANRCCPECKGTALVERLRDDFALPPSHAGEAE